MLMLRTLLTFFLSHSNTFWEVYIYDSTGPWQLNISKNKKCQRERGRESGGCMDRENKTERKTDRVFSLSILFCNHVISSLWVLVMCWNLWRAAVKRRIRDAPHCLMTNRCTLPYWYVWFNAIYLCPHSVLVVASQPMWLLKSFERQHEATFTSPSRILRFCDRWIYRKVKQTQQFSQKITNFHNCHRFSKNFGLRRVLWRHRSVHSVKERLFLRSKNGMNSLAFSSCPIYKSYIGQINWKQNKSSFGLGPDLSITRHRYTQCWEIQWRNQSNSPRNQ